MPLAVLDDARTPVFPDMPTAKEVLGTDSLSIRHWYGVFVASGTPKDVVAKLNEGISSVVNEPEVRQLLVNDGFEIVGNKPDEFQRVIKDEVAAWRTVFSTSESK
jgi:tripartite-type tricarboxylate transporter receptor subunit TctC